MSLGTQSSLGGMLRLLAPAGLVALFPIRASASGAFIDQDARGVKVMQSPIDPDISISYKEPQGACKTALDTQKQITGWVDVPGEDYPIHLFFWFIEAREETDLLSVWLNGGPGSSSMFGFFTGAGPCEVVEEGRKLTTRAREWGWDRVSNMLFIDQPNQVGFSYDTPTDGTWSLYNDTGYVTPPISTEEVPNGNEWLVYNGTFSSYDGDNTANTTATAAEAIYHLMQGFLATFPQYNPPDDMPLGINLFAESYGGKYAPVFADKWAEMNEKRDKGEISSNETVEIDLRSVGIVNGCVDDLVQAPYYPQYMYENYYGLELMNQSQFEAANASFYAEGGCRDAILACREEAKKLDPDHSGDSASVSQICADAEQLCTLDFWLPYADISPLRSWYDISALSPSPFPPSYYMEYLQSAELVAAVGAATNFTMSSAAVYSAFQETGDFELQETVPQLAGLLDRGIRVALLYGDRDYICNWVGGEAVSLAVAEAAGEAYSGGRFARAGYADIQTNAAGYVGGAVRQLGNLSFARVYQAGHALPSYQPETAFQLFARTILGRAMDSGLEVDLAGYTTAGAGAADRALELPDSPEPTCWLRDPGATCGDDHILALVQMAGVVINGVHYFDEDEWTEAEPEEPSGSMTGGIYSGTASAGEGGSGGGGGGSGGTEEAGATGLAVPNAMIAAFAVAAGFAVGGGMRVLG